MPEWTHRFADALRGQIDPQDTALQTLAAQPGFAVYRNTVLKACIDALQANFPAVVPLVGTDWFRAAAGAYALQHWPREAPLLTYGDDGFGAFMQALPSASGVPYLLTVAELDTLWRACHAAAEGAPLRPDALATLAPEQLARQVLWPHPATRWRWCADGPVATIWLRTRAGERTGDLPWQPDGLLLTRPADVVMPQLLGADGCALLDACAAGAPLGEAAERALAAHPEADLAALLGQLLLAGCFDARSLQDT